MNSDKILLIVFEAFGYWFLLLLAYMPTQGLYFKMMKYLMPGHEKPNSIRRFIGYCISFASVILFVCILCRIIFGELQDIKSEIVGYCIVMIIPFTVGWMDAVGQDNKMTIEERQERKSRLS